MSLLSRKLQTIKRITSEAIALRYTPWEFFLMYLNYAVANVTDRNHRLHHRAFAARVKKSLFRRGLCSFDAGNSCYVFGKVRLPRLAVANELFGGTYRDTLRVYVEFGDCYDESVVGELFDLPGENEGPYGLRNAEVDVTVQPGDVVIDAGSWIGDFAAYASAKGASAVYAFEPTDETFEYLLRTAALNPNIHPVRAGLGDAKARAPFFAAPLSGGNSTLAGNAGEERTIDITTIDDFVRENELSRVDFIKADIEGAERQMLRGAAETLRRFAPKLAICTYHLPDDPEVLERIIKESNPAYRVVQKRKKLFASVGA
ncbi:MAG: FkbM family methyltransferase [Synergistaceae bacterium]|jgi:FkbM family methyltransferase|nr:FkbM family methyltransferase [Synergistaceae bacterium]